MKDSTFLSIKNNFQYRKNENKKDKLKSWKPFPTTQHVELIKIIKYYILSYISLDTTYIHKPFISNVRVHRTY
jgi:hypothetical protein